MTDETRSQLDPTPVIRHHKSDEILRIEEAEDFKRELQAERDRVDGWARKTAEMPDGVPTPTGFGRVELMEEGKPDPNDEILRQIAADYEGPSNRLPEASEARKAIPLTTGLLDYFPDALAAVAFVSKVGNDQHNTGQPMHWARGKSNDHADCIARHLVDRGSHDAKGIRHSAYLAWRALALLQEELEVASGLTYSRASR